MGNLFSVFQFFVERIIFAYSVIIITAYVILAIVSAFSLLRYIQKNSFVDYNVILSSPLVPSVSIIAPAFNESKTIVENIRALLSLYYHNYEVVVVNDGSTDNSMDLIIKAYDLELVDFAIGNRIESEHIRGIYKSRNRSFDKLIVVDKVNGGKADSLNAGINAATKDYFVAIDVDSIIQSDALLKLAKPFMEYSDKKVIATGGVIRIANSCIIEDGQLIEVNLPKKFLPRMQVLEYTRAFLMGRMAWSTLDGLLIISGALGMFNREIAIKCGGYFAKTVGEDMELVVRMRRYMCENNLPYKVSYIPDPLCWTEAPETLRVLSRQRNRWTRGNIDTLFIHRKIFFNPKYGLMGMLSYPFWFFIEWLSPLVEVFGLLYFVLSALMGQVNWSFFFIILGFVYAFALTFSTYSILFEELTYHRYRKKREILRMLIAAWIEPIIYHPFIVYYSLKGNFDFFINKKTGWGQMERKGFGKR
jgi:biofilm PGA synthesis N-glycosyltransferase PgaC